MSGATPPNETKQCPRCLGDGEIGMIVGPKAEYDLAECPECDGSGYVDCSA